MDRHAQSANIANQLHAALHNGQNAHVATVNRDTLIERISNGLTTRGYQIADEQLVNQLFFILLNEQTDRAFYSLVHFVQTVMREQAAVVDTMDKLCIQSDTGATMYDRLMKNTRFRKKK